LILRVAEATYVTQAHGGLALSPLPERGGPEGVVRAAIWHNLVHRIGHHLPLLLVHDLGRLIVEGPPRWINHQPEKLAAAGIIRGEPREKLLKTYRALLRRLAETELCRRGPSLGLSDELVAAVVARIYEPILVAMGQEAARAWLALDLPTDTGSYAMEDVTALYAESGGDYEEVALRWIAERGFQIATCAERIDLDTLRLVSLFAGDQSLAGAAAALELYQVLDDPAAADVIHFSLELLPQVFETKRARGIQRFSVDGVAGIGRRGNPDQILPTELAYPDSVFLHKVAENQLLYYGREAERDSERRVHKVMVDASGSMRGARAIFARGLALTLVKKLVLLGEEVELRFFDSRLHESVRITEKNFRLPYLLCFRSERGRNYGRVFKSLSDELERLRRTAGRQAAVYFITHGQCHLPKPLVERLSDFAWLYGIYVLPEGDLDLDYVSLLARHRVVGRGDLAERGTRRQAALSIVEDVVEEVAA
jgi:hypothetical protein